MTSLTTGWTHYAKLGETAVHKQILKFSPCDNDTGSGFSPYGSRLLFLFLSLQHNTSFFPSLGHIPPEHVKISHYM